jgi:hypothetical protein
VSCSTRWERLREEPWCACMESKVVLKLLIESATLCCYFARAQVSE